MSHARLCSKVSGTITGPPENVCKNKYGKEKNCQLRESDNEVKAFSVRETGSLLFYPTFRNKVCAYC